MKTIKLDSKTNGIGVYLYETKDFIKENGEKKLFKNIDVARVYTENLLGNRDPYNYKFWLFVDELEIDYDNVELINLNYQYYHDNELIIIQPDYTDRVIDIAYIVFFDGDTNHTDAKVGGKKSKELYRYIRSALDAMVKYPNANEYHPAIAKISKDNKGHMTAFLKGSTAKFHILYNSQIMDINMKRRDEGVRCIPYEKSMDKFMTIYIYSTIDISDNTDALKDIENLKLDILEFLQTEYPESNPRIAPIEFRGTIIE